MKKSCSTTMLADFVLAMLLVLDTAIKVIILTMTMVLLYQNVASVIHEVSRSKIIKQSHKIKK